MGLQATARRAGALTLVVVSVVALSALVLLASAPPALGHDTCVHHPSDPDALGSGADNSVACLKEGHARIDACDRHSDGHEVWARVTYSDGGIVSFPDTNGANPGCGNWYPGFWGNGFYVAYNVCVQAEGCGSPMYRLGWGSPVW